jgi:hypothetical protein
MQFHPNWAAEDGNHLCRITALDGTVPTLSAGDEGRRPAHNKAFEAEPAQSQPEPVFGGPRRVAWSGARRDFHSAKGTGSGACTLTSTG